MWGGGRGAGARLSPLLLFFLTLGSRSAARAYSSSTWVRGTAVLSSSSSTWRFRAAASRRSSVGRGLPSGWEGGGGRERAGGRVERARARERAAGGALPPSFLPPILALTCQGLPDEALALVLRLLLALQALAVQVLPAQAGVAAQHFFFWWERPTARRMRGGDHERGKRCGRVCVSSFLFGVRCWPEGEASDRVRVCARDGALGAVSGAPVDDSEHTSEGEQNNNPLFLTFANKKPAPHSPPARRPRREGRACISSIPHTRARISLRLRLPSNPARTRRAYASFTFAFTHKRMSGAPAARPAGDPAKGRVAATTVRRYRPGQAPDWVVEEEELVGGKH